MESISQSHPFQKRSGISGGACSSHKSVYDDVFGGPPKFDIPTLAPRLEDYAEIFGGFHASRSSSIPVLDLPLFSGQTQPHFDVRSPGFDYAEVFRDFRGLDSAPSFEDFVVQSTGGFEYGDSDHESWNQAQSRSLSDGLEPLAGHETKQRLSDASANQSTESTMEFHVSYNKFSDRIEETVLTGTTSLAKSDDVPEYACADRESPVSWQGMHEYCTMHVAEDFNCGKDFSGRITEERRYKMSLSNPLYGSFSTYGDDVNSEVKHATSTSPLDKPFVTVSDISLRTKPSRLPPPSRPPPALVVTKGEQDMSNSKIKASKSYVFEKVAEDSASLLFDVEVDASSSADRIDHVDMSVYAEDYGFKESVVEEKTETTSGTGSFQDHRMLNSEETAGSASSTEERSRIGKSGEEVSKSQGGDYFNYDVDISDGTVAWREEPEYFEVVDRNISMEASEMSADAFSHLKTTVSEASDRKQDSEKFELTEQGPKWDEERNHAASVFDMGDKQQIEKPDARLNGEKEFQEKVIHQNLPDHAYDSISMMPGDIQQIGQSQKPKIGCGETVEGQPEVKCDVNGVEIKSKLKSTSKILETEESFTGYQHEKENNQRFKEDNERKECQRQFEELGLEDIGEKEETGQGGAGRPCGKENEKKSTKTHVVRKTGTTLKECNRNDEAAQKSFTAVGDGKKEGQQYLEGGRSKERVMEDDRNKVNDLIYKMDPEHDRNDKDEKLDSEWEMHEANENAPVREPNVERFGKAEIEGVIKKESFERRSAAAGKQEQSGEAEENGYEREVPWDAENLVHVEGNEFNKFGIAYKHKKNRTVIAGKQDHPQVPEATPAPFSFEEHMGSKSQPRYGVYESDSRLDDLPLKGKFSRSSPKEDELQDGNAHTAADDAAGTHSLPKEKVDSTIRGTSAKFTSIRAERTTSAAMCTDNKAKLSTDEDWGRKLKETKAGTKEVEVTNSFSQCHTTRESVVDKRKKEDASSILKQNEASVRASNQTSERKDKNMEDNSLKDQKVRERRRMETEIEKEHIREIEKEREWEREREREKDRMAVDKAALETRERSHAETRERAEKAAVERATAEVRQRALAEARERLEKASMEARLRAERAAVERAIAEARQRAASSRFADTRQSSLPSEYFQSAGISNGLRHTYNSANVGAEGESPQRCKARLERYRRTAERAANALAEKTKRDILAQREREERNRVAEALDAEVKRWSSGKEGNLRALLSTLQYILGPDSGWQPVPLTEVITSAAVKKAYRRATLCVHPDKLQQRGASIQQKYICEKVFDLLKEAWSKFNSEER